MGGGGGGGSNFAPNIKGLYSKPYLIWAGGRGGVGIYRITRTFRGGCIFDRIEIQSKVE